MKLWQGCAEDRGGAYHILRGDFPLRELLVNEIPSEEDPVGSLFWPTDTFSGEAWTFRCQYHPLSRGFSLILPEFKLLSFAARKCEASASLNPFPG